MLAEGQRTSQGESCQHIAAELELLKTMAATIETWSQERMRQAVRRMEAETNDS